MNGASGVTWQPDVIERTVESASAMQTTINSQRLAIAVMLEELADTRAERDRYMQRCQELEQRLERIRDAVDGRV